MKLHRAQPSDTPSPIPEFDGRGSVCVDPTWGTLQPMIVIEGVLTVAELEVIEHLEAGRPVVDSRLAEQFQHMTLPGAVSVPHTETLERRGEFEPVAPTVFFCNGPQCGQSPAAIRALVENGHPVELIWYYRGGLHDWVTLGLPTVSGS